MLKTQLKENIFSHKYINAHEDSILCCAFWKNDNRFDYIITGGADTLVKTWKWDEENLQLQHVFEDHGMDVISVDVNLKGSLAVSSSSDGNICIWDLDKGKLQRTMSHPFDCWTVVLSPDSKYIATGDMRGSVILYAVESEKEDLPLGTLGKFVLSLSYSQDGKYLAAGEREGTVRIYDMSSLKFVRFINDHTMPVRTVAFSKDSTKLLTASDDCTIRLYNVENIELIAKFVGHYSSVQRVDWSPDNEHFLSCSSDNTVKIWNVSSPDCEETFEEHKNQVWCARYNSNGHKIASVSEDMSIVIYELQ